jgi:hypothetical protein
VSSVQRATVVRKHKGVAESVTVCRRASACIATHHKLDPEHLRTSEGSTLAF